MRQQVDGAGIRPAAWWLSLSIFEWFRRRRFHVAGAMRTGVVSGMTPRKKGVKLTDRSGLSLRHSALSVKHARQQDARE